MILSRGICSVLLGCLMCACSSSGEPALETAENEQQKATADAGRTLVVGEAPPGAFVRLEPVFTQEFPSPTGEAFIDQSGQMFEPGAVAVQAGQSIQFRSSEDILHNVRVIRSDDKVPIFNVATPPWGSYTHTFDRAGTYDVTCDIHTAMRATILVAATPYVTIADENGRFQFGGIVAGSYTLIGFSGEHELRRVVRISGTRIDVTVP
jgi:plastocyanin